MLTSQEEASHLTQDQTPARGSINSFTLPRPTSAFKSLASLADANLPSSPNSRHKHSGLQILSTVGIVDLLEQDERPTFIIDVADQTNFGPGGPLQIIFANASLRAHESILEMVTGSANLNSPDLAVTNDFPEFKAWALSYVKNQVSLDIHLPSFLYGSISWSCKTLKKRIRLISASGASILTALRSSGSVGALSNASIFSEPTRGLPSKNVGHSSLIEASEVLDYFGNVATGSNSAAISPSRAFASSASSRSESIPPKYSVSALQGEAASTEIMHTRHPVSPSFDWTRLPPSAALPTHIQFVLGVDWAATPLGPIESWSYDLRAMCNLLMATPHPAAMYWGDQYITIYNEAYILLAGQNHPHMMGQRYANNWPEIWDEIEPVFASAMRHGKSTMEDDDCIFTTRNGYLEESYFSWSIIPLLGHDGSVVGLFNPAFEKTRRKISERRMLTLREVGERTGTARELKSFWGQVITGLDYNEYDVPFALLYSVSDEVDSEISSTHSNSVPQVPQCFLEGTLGVPKGHRAAISPLDMNASDNSFAPYLRESMKTDQPVLLTIDEGTLPFELIKDLNFRGFGDPCRAAVVCPIHATTTDSILGFLVMGVNPRRPYDDDYSLFVQLLTRQIATSMASVVLFEEEIRRSQRAALLAALDRQELSKLLDIRTQEAVESETRFTRMAEFAPVGMFIADSQGRMTYSNNYLKFSSNDGWMDGIMEDDAEVVRRAWKKMLTDKIKITQEFRFKEPWKDPNGNSGEMWVLMSVYPEKDDKGDLKSVFGSITNISQQKWAEDYQKQRREEAIKLKRDQEHFIDFTSHEMRNPLSAILQCADEISKSLTDFRYAEDYPNSSQNMADILDSSIDAAETISLCAQHQKRIVDDILTLSKLDSAVLIVALVTAQPVAVVQRVIKMFEGELETNDIAMEFRMDKSYLDMAIDWVRIDPSRLLQILINLITNAIKFTPAQGSIIIRVSASTERPSGPDSNVSYFPTRLNRKDLTAEEEWGAGEAIYLCFAVSDTGRGLAENEIQLLFQRFSQASPRTHVKYGGSGLGLFISRELTEIQGGEIGVASERGVGSTFAFYVKARKVDHRPSDTPSSTPNIAYFDSLRRNSSNTSVTIESRRNSTAKAIHRSSTLGKRPRNFPVSPRTSVSVDYSKMTVLIVEDNIVNQTVLRKQLRNVGFETGVANHGLEALEYIKTSRFWAGRETDGVDLTIILMDLEMPIMDGLTCARQIRALEATGTITKHIPIIAVTANARLEQIENAIVAGMDIVVSKPFRISELIPKIEELVAKSLGTTDTSTRSSSYSIAESGEGSSSLPF